MLSLLSWVAVASVRDHLRDDTFDSTTTNHPTSLYEKDNRILGTSSPVSRRRHRLLPFSSEGGEDHFAKRLGSIGQPIAEA